MLSSRQRAASDAFQRDRSGGASSATFTVSTSAVPSLPVTHLRVLCWRDQNSHTHRSASRHSCWNIQLTITGNFGPSSTPQRSSDRELRGTSAPQPSPGIHPENATGLSLLTATGPFGQLRQASPIAAPVRNVLWKKGTFVRMPRGVSVTMDLRVKFGWKRVTSHWNGCRVGVGLFPCSLRRRMPRLFLRRRIDCEFRLLTTERAGRS